MKLNNTSATTLRGFSIVEMMVALSIGLILTLGVVQLFATNKANYEVTDDLSMLQENARFAMNFIMNDLRRVGYFGCPDNISTMTNNIVVNDPADVGDLWDLSFSLEGYDPSISTTTWFPSTFTGLPANRVAGMDMITIRYLDVRDPEAITNASATSVTVGDVTGFQTDQFVGVSDCSSTDAFQITAVNTATGAITHGTTGGTGTPGNDDPNLSRQYDPADAASVSPLRLVRYYIGTGTSGTSLYRQTIDGGNVVSEELVPGVENMQILYGVDTTGLATGIGDGIPDEYLRAGQVGVTADLSDANWWSRVISVRIGLSVRTEDEYGTVVDTRNRNLNGTPTGVPNDRRQRRLFTSTLLIRNMI